MPAASPWTGHSGNGDEGLIKHGFKNQVIFQKGPALTRR
jgi:hypothetical protein